MKVLKKPATKLTGEIRKSITSKLMFSYTRWQRKLKKPSLLEYVEFFCREKLYICSIILKRQFFADLECGKGVQGEFVSFERRVKQFRAQPGLNPLFSLGCPDHFFETFKLVERRPKRRGRGDDLFWERLRDYQAETFRRAEGRERFSRYFIYLTLGVVRIGHKCSLSKNDIIS